ncbi:hypothetical protein H0H92_014046 [Tricholoma furcatifolium]|nr:hypothetical protein H0H92_014046 [Tricholoma furcatifolium]
MRGFSILALFALFTFGAGGLLLASRSLGMITDHLQALPASDMNSPDSVSARNCQGESAAFNKVRRENRELTKRTFLPAMENLDCTVAPETPLVDYVANPLVRQDLTDNQVGIALTLDLGILDITTCEPLPNVMVEVWSANAVGEYGSFLRGAFTSASNGIAEFQTIFPGFTTGSANHISLIVHNSASMDGTVVHVGQIFFTDQWTNVVGMYQNYAANNNTRMLNDEDPNYALANSGGYNAIVEYVSDLEIDDLLPLRALF